MFRKFAAIVAVGILGVMTSSSRADSVVANLGSVGPAIATATISTSPGLTFYAGQLNWSVVATYGPALANTTGFGTYCIDITHDISTGNDYEFDVDPLSSASGLAGNYNYGSGTVLKVAAIETLYSDFYSPSLSDEQAGAFQGAVWSILFGPSTISLNDGTANGIEAADLGTLDGQLALGTTLDYYNVMALVADPSSPVGKGPIPGYTAQGQDQALVVLPTFGSVPVPLPSTSMGGCVLLGLFGVGVASKKRFSTAQ
jgi:hypothetical protein